MKPRPYQLEACDLLLAPGASTTPVVEMATGLGKTPTMAFLSERFKGPILVVVHRDELVQQTLDKFAQVAPGMGAGVVKAERNEIGRALTVASAQTLLRAPRAAALFGGAEFSVAHVDEVHHYRGDNRFGDVVRAIPARLKVGWTATAFKDKGGSIAGGGLWDKIVYRKNILWGIQNGYLCNLRAKQIALDVDLSGVKVRGGDFAEEALGAALRAPGASEEIAQGYKDHAFPRKALCFAASVAQAHDISEKLVNMGISAAAVWGEQAIEERRATLRRFSEGAIKVLVNCAVLLEGYDEPSIECVMVARPTLSKLMYCQMVGRGTRLYPGKLDCLILDFVAASSRHSLETMASMFGITEGSAEAGIEALLARAKEETGEAGEVIGSSAEDVDLWAPPSGRLHWIPDGRRFLLSLGESTLALVPAGLTWEIKEFPRGVANPTKKLFAGLTLEYAQGVAEDLVRQQGAWALAAEGASWRMAPASDGQRKVYSEKGWGEPRSRGAASDRMTVEFNRRRA